MVILLIAIILLLIAAIIYLNIAFYKEKRLFRIRIESLQQIIADITKTQSGQVNRLRLSDALDEKLKADNATLNHDIFGLNFELFDILSKNNLLKK